MGLRAGVHKFSKNPEAASISRRKIDMKQVPYWEPKTIRRHRAKFRRHGALTPDICTLLSWGNVIWKCELDTVSQRGYYGVMLCRWQPNFGVCESKDFLISSIHINEDTICASASIGLRPISLFPVLLFTLYDLLQGMETNNFIGQIKNSCNWNLSFKKYTNNEIQR